MYSGFSCAPKTTYLYFHVTQHLETNSMTLPYITPVFIIVTITMKVFEPD